MNKIKHNCDNINCNHNDTKGLCCLFNPENCKYRQLQKENAELKKELKTAYRKGMRHMAKALKDYDRTDGAWTDYFEHIVDKVLQREQLDFEEYGTLAEQLTKATEIIKKLKALYFSPVVTKDDVKRQDEILAEVEQFLQR